MPPFIDLSGKKFNRLTVIERGTGKGNGAYWICLCDCGNMTTLASQAVKDGYTKSCGCLQKERASKSNIRHGGTARQTYHPSYHVWTGLRARCNNSNHPKFSEYGGRGITVCDRWVGVNGFINFLSDMGDRPSGFSIDRIDVNGNYSPENCRWATPKQQSVNRRNTYTLCIDGEEKTIAEWAIVSGVKPDTIRQRIKRDGHSAKSAVFGHIRYWKTP